MKKILTLIISIVFTGIVSAQDSSRAKLSLTVQARDCEYIALLFERTNKYEIIDSTTRSKFRVQSPPTGNTNVTIDSVEQRIWLEIINRIATDYIGVHLNVFKRLDDAVRLTSAVWLVNKLDKEVTNRDFEWNMRRGFGRKYLKKQED